MVVLVLHSAVLYAGDDDDIQEHQIAKPIPNSPVSEASGSKQGALRSPSSMARLMRKFKRSDSKSSENDVSSYSSGSIVAGSSGSSHSPVIVGSVGSASSNESWAVIPRDNNQANESLNRRAKIVNKVKKFLNRRNRVQRNTVHDQEDWVMIESNQAKGDDEMLETAQAKGDNEMLETARLLLKAIGQGVPEIFIEGESEAYTKDQKTEIDVFIVTFEVVINKLNLYRMRSDPNFVTSYEETLATNFDNVSSPAKYAAETQLVVNDVREWDDALEAREIEKHRSKKFNPKTIYDYLGCTEADSCEKIREMIQKRKVQHPDHEPFFRQLEYPFLNILAKQHYDAYLKGADELKKLQILDDETAPLSFFVLEALMCKGDLQNYKRQTASSSAIDQQSQHDLAGHALLLDLDVKTNI